MKERKKRIVKKSEFNLKNEYKLSWDFINESRKFIYLIILVFVGFMLIGFFAPVPDSIKQQIFDFIKELIAKTQGMSQLDLIQFIFLNNLQSSFMGMILGVVFGIFPIIATIVNGYLLGVIGSLSVDSEGILSLWRILPHGIFELPAIFISLGLGLKIGTFIFEKEKSKSFKEFFWNSLRVFIFIVLPLLIIAAVIEGSLIFFSG